MRAVNLLPPDERRKGLDSSARKPLVGAAAGIVVVTVLATFLASLASVDASDKRSRLAAVEAELAALPRPERPAYDVNALVQERTERELALAAALADRVAFDALMRQIALVLPGNAWLTQLQAARPVEAEGEAVNSAPAPDSGVTIQGETWTLDDVAVVVARLGTVPTLTDVRLTTATRVEPSGGSGGEGSGTADASPGRPYVTFAVSANVRTGDGP